MSKEEAIVLIRDFDRACVNLTHAVNGYGRRRSEKVGKARFDKARTKLFAAMTGEKPTPEDSEKMD